MPLTALFSRRPGVQCAGAALLLFGALAQNAVADDQAAATPASAAECLQYRNDEAKLYQCFGRAVGTQGRKCLKDLPKDKVSFDMRKACVLASRQQIISALDRGIEEGLARAAAAAQARDAALARAEQHERNADQYGREADQHARNAEQHGRNAARAGRMLAESKRRQEVLEGEIEKINARLRYLQGEGEEPSPDM